MILLVSLITYYSDRCDCKQLAKGNYRTRYTLWHKYPF